MPTTKQVADRAGKSDNTIRNWVAAHPDLFSPSAQPDGGQRIFTEDDARVCEALAALTGTGLPLQDAANRVRVQGFSAVVEVEAQALQPSLQEPATPMQTPPSAAAPLRQAFITLQDDYRALQQRHEKSLKDRLWSHAVAFYLGVVTMGLLFWIVWLLNRWWYG